MEPSGPVSSGQNDIIIAAAPETAEATTLADALRALNWNAIVTADVAPYASAARACVALITPQTINGPALQSALSSHPHILIPVLTAPLPLPYGPWTVGPIFMGESPAQTAGAIVNTVLSLNVAPPFAAPPTTPFAPPQPAMGYAPAPMTPVPPRARSHKGLWITLGVTLAVIVLLCAGGVALVLSRNLLPISTLSNVTAPKATALPTFTPPAPTPTIPAGFKVYTDSSGRFQMITPTDWATSSASDFTDFLNVSPAAIFEVTDLSGTLSPADIETTETSFFHSMSVGAGGSGKYTLVGNPTSIELSGEGWTQETADVDIKGETLLTVVLMASHNGYTYLIAYAAAPSDFAKVEARYFEPMLQSYQFLS